MSHPGIRARLWLAAALPTVLVVLALLWVFLSRYTDDLTEAWRERARVAATHPDLLIRGEHIKPLQLLTYTCIPLSVGMFPHMFIHWLTARSARSFRPTIAF